MRSRRLPLFADGHSAPSSQFDYDALDGDSPPSSSQTADLLAALISSASAGVRLDGPEAHRIIYARMCALVFTVSPESELVSAMAPARVAARTGVSREYAGRVMRAYMAGLGMQDAFESRLARGIRTHEVMNAKHSRRPIFEKCAQK